MIKAFTMTIAAAAWLLVLTPVSAKIGSSSEASYSFTEETSTGFMDEFSNSLMGVLIGVILFFGSHVLLFWNEGRTLRRENMLLDASRRVKELNADQFDPTLEQQLVHATHSIEAKEALEDGDLGLVGNNSIPALKYKRTVSLYQWVESSSSKSDKQLGGGKRTLTTYEYKKEWKTELINTKNFKRLPSTSNPTQKPLNDRTLIAQSISFGAYQLSDTQKQQILTDEPFTVPMEVKNTIGARFPQLAVHINANTIWLGNDPINNPEIGDVRIDLFVATPRTVSIMAQPLTHHDVHTFAPFQLDGDSIDLLHAGSQSAQQMIETERSSNTLLKWGIRLLGFVCMWAGLNLIAGPIEAIADIIPLIGYFVSMATGTISLMVCFPLTLLTISIAWIYYRPKVGIVLLLVALAVLYFVRTATAGNCSAQQKEFDSCVAQYGGQVTNCQRAFSALRACRR